ncbi:oxygen-independent coproporphyrinogen III oxidase [Hahella aquimaris]|uniref:oxygen-independent coproporphyrinogen III oxidase n=1 Tax=Hahella sp. HNIBRBA332 TaxID=3015983 RepID=UPI00273BC8A4|nr:oxygen-independent coproporphyrinogen III oxidase [Hahella sp. HNIBRBA332]WLQ15310.1 oxygen-independent coproporphyrinogen III oxidase [Hahella sp. HNIBRBA332]
MKNIYWNESLIRKYDLQGPRYTSYPTAVEFQNEFPITAVYEAAAASRTANRSLSLYLHIPFCARLCYYCACNKIITKRREKAIPYLDALYREIALQSELFGADRLVEQLHWGGGTPTFLAPQQMRDLMNALRTHFRFMEDDQGDYSIEIDPREADDETLTTLREIGFNRISLGVQDFNPAVQKAVNRIQSEELTLGVLRKARELGFRSINIDLIYGLPLQTPDSFRKTVDTIIDFAPDRLSVFNYAHMPQRFMPQRRIRDEDLPRPEDKLTILQQSVDQLIAADYRFIGMDHFAKPGDELSIAQEKGELHRNFQGYTTHGDCDLIAMGASSISMLDRCYYQNCYDQETYEAAMAENRLPVIKGVQLNDDDVIRRKVIVELICNFKIEYRRIETLFNIDFAHYFQGELRILQDMAQDGLITFTHDGLHVNPTGRLLIRGVCKVFDRYRTQAQQGFSRII